MRAAVAELLATIVTAVHQRVLEPHMANAQTQKPFLIVRQGIQESRTNWAASGTTIEVWPYVDKTTFQEVDALEVAVVGALQGARIRVGSDQYLLHHGGGAGADLLDEERSALTRGIRFQAYTLGWRSGLTYQPDPVAALQSWTAASWPGALDTNPDTWAPTNVKPGVYWRLVTLEEGETTAAVCWLGVQLRAHVVAPDASVQAIWCRRIAERLAGRPRLYLSDGGPLFIEQAGAEVDLDPMRVGQITLRARFGLLPEKGAVSILKRSVLRGSGGR